MTNKEKLEIIDEQLEMLYEELADLVNCPTTVQHNITQAIYNLESTKLLLEPIPKKYIFPIDGIPEPDEDYLTRELFKFNKCNQKLVKKEN